MSRRVPPFPNAPKFVDTLTNLKAKGTSSGVAAGDLAFATSGEGLVICDVPSASTSTWKSSVTQNFIARGAAIGTALRYLDWAQDLENAAIAGNWTRQVLSPGYAFRVEALYWRVLTDPGSTTIGIYKNKNTSAVATVTDTPAGADSGVNSTVSVDFAASDDMEISIDGTTDPTDARIQVTIRRLYP